MLRDARGDADGLTDSVPDGHCDAVGDVFGDVLLLRDARADADLAAEFVASAEVRAERDSVAAPEGSAEAEVQVEGRALVVLDPERGRDGVSVAVSSELTEGALLTDDKLETVAAVDADSDNSELPVGRSENVAVAIAEGTALVLPDGTREAVAAFE